MTTIWKYPLGPANDAILMPQGAQILSVQVQHGQPCVWAMVDEKSPLLPRKLRIYGTGHPLPFHPGKFIGTFQLSEGMLVFHLFEEG